MACEPINTATESLLKLRNPADTPVDDRSGSAITSGIGLTEYTPLRKNHVASISIRIEDKSSVLKKLGNHSIGSDDSGTGSPQI